MPLRSNASSRRCHITSASAARLTPGAGLSAREGIEFLRGLFGLDIIAVDVNTVNPPLDVQNMTAFLAAQIIYESLALLCQRPG